MKKTISFKGTPVTIEDKLNVGDVFPNFRAVTKTLSEFELTDYRGKNVIVNTFPSVDTGICALQTIKFNKEVSDLTDTVVITVSKDLPFFNQNFNDFSRNRCGHIRIHFVRSDFYYTIILSYKISFSKKPFYNGCLHHTFSHGR